MEMHLLQSLYEAHGAGITASLRPRRHSIARLGFARILAFLKRMATAIKAELAVRRAIAEVASMNDYMLRDIGISRHEIESAVRGLRTTVGTEGMAVLWSDSGERCQVLPTISSPDIASETRPAQELRKLPAPAMIPLAQIGSPLK